MSRWETLASARCHARWSGSMLLAFAVGSAVAFSPSVPSRNNEITHRHTVLMQQQKTADGRRAILIGAGAFTAFSHPGAASAPPGIVVTWAASEARQNGARPFDFKTSKKADLKDALYRSALEQSDKLVFSDLGWGDAEVKVLSQELFAAKDLKKLFLNGNRITDDGVAAIADALFQGAAPNLKTLNLSQKPGLMSEKARRCLMMARPGLQVSYASLKQASDADVYKAADDGALNSALVIERAKNGKLIDGSSATCNELSRIIDVDRSALKASNAPLMREMGIDQNVEQVVAQQIEKLVLLKRSRGC